MPGRLEHLIGLTQTADRISSAPETGRGGNHRRSTVSRHEPGQPEREMGGQGVLAPTGAEEKPGQLGGGTDHGEADLN